VYLEKAGLEEGVCASDFVLKWEEFCRLLYRCEGMSIPIFRDTGKTGVPS
jgi:hypothetical protein